MENTYTLCAPGEEYLLGFQTNPFTFQTESNIPLPNSEYLRIHAAYCRVAHLSGAAEQMDEILEDLEDMRVLSKDGSSAHALSFVLQPFSQEVVR